MALLIRMLTWQSAMTGLGVTLGVIPFSIWVGRVQTRVRLRVVQRTDARVKLTGEVLAGGALMHLQSPCQTAQPLLAYIGAPCGAPTLDCCVRGHL